MELVNSNNSILQLKKGKSALLKEALRMISADGRSRRCRT
jgi:hypothetical protein